MKGTPFINQQVLRASLQDFEPSIRRAGEQLWTQRSVVQLIKTADDYGYLEFQAVVRDGRTYQLELVCDAKMGWGTFCSCEEECFCQHGYAALRELLARLDGHGHPPTEPRPVPLAVQVQQALGQPLKRPQKELLRRVELQYYRVRLCGCLTNWDLYVMGLDPAQSATFPEVQLPLISPDQLDFLRLTLWVMTEHRLPVPPFLQPLVEDQDFQARLEAARLAQRIEHWKGVWRKLGTQAPPSLESEPKPLQLRLRLSTQGAIPEWIPPARNAFVPLKKRDLQEIQESLNSGELRLPSGGGLLWSLLEPRITHGSAMVLNYGVTHDARGLRRMLLQPDGIAQLANHAGDPLLLSDQPLRWQLSTPDTNGSGCYRLRLVHGDREDPGPFMAVLTGAPTLFLNRHAAFRGPPLPQDALQWLAEPEIPAAAVECPDGILCLYQLGVPLPDHLERQIRVDTVKVSLTCRLEKPRFDPNNEICVFEVIAVSSDQNVQERWTPNDSWAHHRGARQRRTEPASNEPVVYDRQWQQKAAASLASLPLRLSSDGRPMLKVTKTFAQTLLDWLSTVPPEITVRLEGELRSLAADPLAARVRLEAREVSIDWFDLRVLVDTTEAELTPEELKLLLAHRGQPVRLPHKGWRRLAFDLSAEEDEQLARLGLSPRELTDEPQRLHALQLADPAARKLLPTAQIEAIQRRASEIRARVTPPPPEGLQAELRPYQTDGFHFLAYLATNRFGGILADDMGLGKTLQTLVWVTWLRRSHASVDSATDPPQPPPPSLVVCPKSVMDNWRAEAERFTPGLRVKVWSTPGLPSLAQHLEDAEIHVVNYTQLRLAEDPLTAVRWMAVVLDEGQFIKNPDSQTAQAARRLQAEHRLVLSGTPIENRLLDLWSLMSFAMPGVLGHRALFHRIYDAAHDPLARQRLAARVRPFLLRRTKSQVARDLPDRVEEDLYCELEGLQRTLYQAELKRARQLLLRIQTQSELAAQQFNFLTSLLRLRQICCHPALVQPSPRAESAKFGALMEQLDPLMAEGHKVLVFSQFVGLLDLLQPQIQQRDWPVFRLTGATEDRAQVVQAFQSAPDGAVFLLSLKAGSFGLNLTAASYVILFDPWWNPAVENQAIDRTHRIGQNRTVIAYRLLIKNSIEEKVRLLQKQKQALAEDILGEERFAQALTLDDLHFLFAD